MRAPCGGSGGAVAESWEAGSVFGSRLLLSYFPFTFCSVSQSS